MIFIFTRKPRALRGGLPGHEVVSQRKKREEGRIEEERGAGKPGIRRELKLTSPYLD
jgi:hypothetical protein